jgi:DNA modification methylase
MDGGSLVTYPNFLRLESLKVIEKSGLKYRQAFCVKLNGLHGKNRAFGNTIDIGWKSLEWFVKGNNGKTNRPAFIYDFIESESPKKIMHEWEQSTVEAERMIKGFTVEGQVVLDPMMGYATNGEAALKLNRQFIGIEKDPIHFSNAQRRLNSMTMVTVK